MTTLGPFQRVEEAEWAARPHYPHRVVVPRPDGLVPPILVGIVRHDIVQPALLRHLFPINRWCIDQYGENGLRSVEVMEDGPVVRTVLFADYRWCSFMDHFYFKNQDDAFEFKIRWG